MNNAGKRQCAVNRVQSFALRFEAYSTTAISSLTLIVLPSGSRKLA
jgi:hypothetical protein